MSSESILKLIKKVPLPLQKVRGSVKKNLALVVSNGKSQNPWLHQIQSYGSSRKKSENCSFFKKWYVFEIWSLEVFS